MRWFMNWQTLFDHAHSSRAACSAASTCGLRWGVRQPSASRSILKLRTCAAPTSPPGSSTCCSSQVIGTSVGMNSTWPAGSGVADVVVLSWAEPERPCSRSWRGPPIVPAYATSSHSTSIFQNHSLTRVTTFCSDLPKIVLSLTTLDLDSTSRSSSRRKVQRCRPARRRVTVSLALHSTSVASCWVPTPSASRQVHCAARPQLVRNSARRYLSSNE
mmetsp:Transcript_4383/g.14136  ORF Transcript_4383/g.14136 Transcript_4383/m.14136 type:complete len:216 (-) Transcript_4383:152-799(-)